MMTSCSVLYFKLCYIVWRSKEFLYFYLSPFPENAIVVGRGGFGSKLYSMEKQKIR